MIPLECEGIEEVRKSELDHRKIDALDFPSLYKMIYKTLTKDGS